MHKSRGKRRKASRLRKRSDKLSDKARDVACKITQEEERFVENQKKWRGFYTHHQLKEKQRILMARKIVSSYNFKPSKKRPGIHSKTDILNKQVVSITVGDCIEGKEDSHEIKKNKVARS